MFNYYLIIIEPNEGGLLVEGIDYLKELRKKYERNFDIEEDTTVSSLVVDLFAKSHIRNEKFFGSKSVTLYSFENHEYCYVKYLDIVSSMDIEEFSSVMKTEISKKVIVNEDHMSSTFTGIIVTKKIVNPEIIKIITNYSYQKSYCFGLKGWSDIRLILVELETNMVYTSKKARDVKKLYQPA